MYIKSVTRNKEFTLDDFKAKLELKTDDFDVQLNEKGKSGWFQILEVLDNGDEIKIDLDSEAIAQRLELPDEESKVIDIYRHSETENSMFKNKVTEKVIVVCRIGMLSLEENTKL